MQYTYIFPTEFHRPKEGKFVWHKKTREEEISTKLGLLLTELSEES